MVQGAIAIENGAVMSPCSRANINAEMRLGGRAFALHLDITARIADAVSQAGRAAHDARRFVNGAVGIVQGQAVTEPSPLASSPSILTLSMRYPREM